MPAKKFKKDDIAIINDKNVSGHYFNEGESVVITRKNGFGDYRVEGRSKSSYGQENRIVVQWVEDEELIKTGCTVK